MFRRVNYVWRVLGTGFSFALFGVGAVILGTAIFFLISLAFRDQLRRQGAIRKAISFCFGKFFLIMHHLGLLKFRIVGGEKLAQDKGCLVIANHPSLIDIVALISVHPNANCIVKKELWNNFFTKWIVTAAGYIPNDDPENLLKDCAQSLARGEVLMIFPEGTRSKPGQPLVLHRGAARIAVHLKCDVRTVHIRVEPPTLTKGLPWYQVPPRRADFEVIVKDLIRAEEFTDPAMPPSLGARRLTARMLENIQVVHH